MEQWRKLDVQLVTLDTGYKTPWIAKKIPDTKEGKANTSRGNTPMTK
ncbi:MAG: hypothetical protein LUC30_10390 [Clostridiales bacterium]|nr:hypothetical protein [Clostridiales bacterium]